MQSDGRCQSGAPPSGTTVAPEAVREELERILASRSFAPSPQLSRFLRFIVERALAGEGDRLKEYSIGADVLGRGAAFDPRVDSVVRTQATRLRQKLREYYQAEGALDAVRIELPKGSYVPSLEYPVNGDGRARRVRGPVAWQAAAIAAALILAALLVYGWRRSGAAAERKITSVAVLPFESLDADPESAYLSAGVVEELTTRLAKVKSLRVIARTSAGQFRKGSSVEAIARQLHVGAVVEGSVLRSHGRLRLNVQLIDAASQSHLWAEAYDRDLKDAYTLCDEVAHSVAASLVPRSAPAAVATQANAPDPQAVELYWRGRYFRRQKLAEGLPKAIAQYQQAIEQDPAYAPAWAALADAYTTMGFHGLAPSAETIPRAKAAAQKARVLDGTLGEPYGVLGWIEFFNDWNWPDAERDFRRAVDLNPNDAKAHNLFALGLASRGRFAEALAESQRAVTLDPLSYLASNDAGVIFYAAHRYDEAVRCARRALELDAANTAAHALLGVAESGRRRYSAAIAEFDQALAGGERDSSNLGRMGYAYALAGNVEKAHALLAELARTGHAAAIHSAFICVGLGDKKRALEFLQKSADRREADLIFAGFEPIFDSLRADPEFLALMKRIGLPAGRL